MISPQGLLYEAQYEKLDPQKELNRILEMDSQHFEKINLLSNHQVLVKLFETLKDNVKSLKFSKVF